MHFPSVSGVLVESLSVVSGGCSDLDMCERVVAFELPICLIEDYSLQMPLTFARFEHDTCFSSMGSRVVYQIFDI